jgi:MFS family permease
MGGIGAALSNRNYRIFTEGHAVSLVGFWVQRVAVGWLTWDLTHSGTWLGLMAFADLAPTLVISPIAGAVADRIDLVKLLKWTQIVSLAQAVVLALLMLAGYMTVWLLLVLTVILGLASAFAQPVRMSLVPSLVGRESLTAAVAINASVFNIAMFVGPATAGLLIATSGLAPAFAFNALSYLIFLIALARIRLPPTNTAIPRGNLLRDIAQGMRYAALHPVTGPMLVLILSAALFARPISELLPGFADRVFDRGAVGLAWLTSGMGLGALACGIWLAYRGRVEGLTGIAVTHLMVVAFALIGFLATDSFWLALFFLAISAWGKVAIYVGGQTLIMSTVEGSIRGRVMGIYGLIGRGGPALGALIMGALSEIVGLKLPVAGGAAICLVAWIWMLTRQRRVAQIAEATVAANRAAEPTA